MKDEELKYTLMVSGKVALDFKLAGTLEQCIALEDRGSYLICRYLSQEEEDKMRYKSYIFPEGKEAEKRAVKILAEVDDFDNIMKVINNRTSF